MLPQIEHMPNGSAAVMFTMGVMHHLAEEGMLAEGIVVLTPKGLALYDQLVASGYRPVDDEIRETLRYMLANDMTEEMEEDHGDS